MTHSGAATGAMPLSPPLVSRWQPEWIPAYLSNGVIGLRVCPIPTNLGVAVVSGYEGMDPSMHVAAATTVPFPLALEVTIGQTGTGHAPQAASFRNQRYDFERGELTTTFVVETSDATATIETLHFCSRTLPACVAQEIRVRVDRECSMEMVLGIDPTKIAGRWRSRLTEIPGVEAQAVDGSLLWESLGALSTCGAAYWSDSGGAAEKQLAQQEIERPLQTRYPFQAEAGRTYRFRQITAMVPSASHHTPDQHAVRLVGEAARRGFDRLRDENASAWREIWRGRIVLVGADDRWQRIADAAYYYLHASVHPSSVSSTSLFGLAQWPNYHYYYGHVMWDLDCFCVPVLSVTAPDCAATMLGFRSARLPAARANAKLWGYRGVQFPWESSLLLGEEAAPGLGSGAAFEQHVNLEVALAFARHAAITRDERFLREQAWPVLRGVAEWLESRVVASERGYEIREVNGIAERKQPADNNAYVNMAAAVTLQNVAAAAEAIGKPVQSSWRQIARELTLPLDGDHHSIVSHDGYSPNEEQGDAPEPLAGLFPAGYPLPPDLERNTLRYFLADTGGGYIGKPMLSALYGVWATLLGDRCLASELLERGYGDFIQEPYWETDEYSDRVKPDYPRVGPFFANIGGFLMSCLYGFPRMYPSFGEPTTWATEEAVMPDLWQGIEVERLWVGGEEMSLMASHGRVTQLSLLPE